MYTYAEKSKKVIETCNHNLVIWSYEVIKRWDCSALDGFRNRTRQDKAYRDGFSKLQYPHSKHNKIPSMAIHLVPYLRGKAMFGNTETEKLEMCYFAGGAMMIGKQLYESGQMSLELLWGGDWNQNNDLSDNWQDMAHFELIIK